MDKLDKIDAQKEMQKAMDAIIELLDGGYPSSDLQRALNWLRTEERNLYEELEGI